MEHCSFLSWECQDSHALGRSWHCPPSPWAGVTWAQHPTGLGHISASEALSSPKQSWSVLPGLVLAGEECGLVSSAGSSTSLGGEEVGS